MEQEESKMGQPHTFTQTEAHSMWTQFQRFINAGMDAGNSLYLKRERMGQNDTVLYFDCVPVSPIICTELGAIYIKMERRTTMSAWGGVGDTGIKIRMENCMDNTTSLGGVTGIDLRVRNDDISASCSNIYGVLLRTENTSDVQTRCSDMRGLDVTMFNQGVVEDRSYGIRVIEASGGTNPTDTVGVYIVTWNQDNAPAGGGRADALKIYSEELGDAWTDGIHIGTHASSSGMTNAIHIATGVITTGILIEDDATDGIKITGECTDGIEISGDCTTGLNISATGIARAIMVGAFGEASNLVMTNARNYPMGVFAKVTADIAPTNDMRCAWFRLRVNTHIQVGTSANWGSALRGMQGSLKFYGGTGGGGETGTYCWCNAGVFGSIETDGKQKVAFKDGSVTGALFAHVGLIADTNDYVDIESGAVVAGVAINCGTSTASNVTVDGKFCGLYIYNDVGNQSFNYGIFIGDPSIQYAVMIGESGTGGMLTSQTNRAHLGVFGYMSAAVSSGSETMRCIRARHQVAADITSDASLYAVQAYVVISTAGIDMTQSGACTFGTYSGLETSGSSLVIDRWAGGLVTVCSAVTGWTLGTNGILCGVMIQSQLHDTNTITAGGILAGLYIHKGEGKEAWDYAIYMPNDTADHLFGFTDGTGLADANGMTGSKAMNILSHWDGWVRIDIGGTDHYIPTCLDPTSA